MPDYALSAYNRALLEARSRTQSLTGASLRRLLRAFEEAQRQLNAATYTNDLAASRGTEIRAKVRKLLDTLSLEMEQAAVNGVRLTLDQIARIHEEVHADIGKQYKVTGLDRGFAEVPTQALTLLNARRQNAATFKTLVKYHMRPAAETVDRLIGSALTRGVGSRQLTKDIAKLLGGRVIDAAAYGLSPGAATGLKTLWSDSRMIAMSEISNAMRESNALSLARSRIASAGKWQTSGAHPRTDACDSLAAADWYGFGPGFYPGDKWPIAPHPHCGCYQGSVILRSPNFWSQPKESVPMLKEPNNGSNILSSLPEAERRRQSRISTAAAMSAPFRPLNARARSA